MKTRGMLLLMCGAAAGDMITYGSINGFNLLTVTASTTAMNGVSNESTDSISANFYSDTDTDLLFPPYTYNHPNQEVLISASSRELQNNYPENPCSSLPLSLQATLQAPGTTFFGRP